MKSASTSGNDNRVPGGNGEGADRDVLVSLGPDHAWLLRGAKTFERLALPDLTVPLDDPCKTYAALVESLGEKTNSKPPIPGDNENGTGARTQPTPTAGPQAPSHNLGFHISP